MFRRFVLMMALLALIAMPGRLPAAAGPEHGAAAAPDAHASAGGHGREHQVIEFDAAQAIWVLIIFVVLLAVLYPFAWKQVLAGLKGREERIRKDIADAEAARARAEATLKEYHAQLATAEEKVREMISGAVAQGEKIAADIRAKAQQEAEDTKQRALRDIDDAGKQAVTELYRKAADLATGVASKILRRQINAQDQQDLVRQSLDELEAVQK